jgi:hypothetical protein
MRVKEMGSVSRISRRDKGIVRELTASANMQSAVELLDHFLHPAHVGVELSPWC